MFMMRHCVGLLLASSALAYRGSRTAPRTGESQLDHGNLAAITTNRYANDCWKQRPVRKLALNEHTAQTGKAELPGAGMNPASIKPFQTVLKDGFLKVSCIKDSLLSFGDKFGDGKYSYNLGDVSNVSIVHYESIIIKEERVPMTYEVCFEFCRTVPDMHNFGIHNGRDCYCAPYFKAMESDSTECDAVCEGNPTQMCGGKVKSTVFSMHMCADSGAELEAASTKGTTVLQTLDGLISRVGGLASDMQTGAADLQKAYGKLGDPIASDLMQAAKVRAGEIEHEVEDKAKISSALTDATKQAAQIDNSTLLKASVASKAEGLTTSLNKLIADAEDAVEELTASENATSPGSNASVGAGKQYYPLMYFVDKAFQDAPTTCSGTPVATPIVGVLADDCAAACDSHVETCVGYAFFSTPPSLCFLFSRFKDAKYYTGCDSAAFLQRKGLDARNASGAPAACMAKLSKFQGTSVKPDPSGKCPGCLKTATSSTLCPQA